MDLKSELQSLLQASVPLVQLVTYEEARVIQTLTDIFGTAAGKQVGLVAWDLADGFEVIKEGTAPFPQKECTTDTVLPHLADKMPPGYVVVLKDFHHAWIQKKGYITRKLRNMAAKLRSKSQCLVFVSPVSDLPAELKVDMLTVHVPLPDQDELERLFGEVTSKLDRKQLPRPELREKIVSSALGLTTNQFRLVLSRVGATHGRFDEQAIDLILRAKQDVIRESGALEFWPASAGESNVGGLDIMKEWLRKREIGFSAEAKACNVPFPRGVALIGIPGTGKSLSAKMLSGLWKLPLLRLDVGAVLGSGLGDSEANIRKAVMLADTVSPCILWIDEVEKAFAGMSAQAVAAGGSAARMGVFGTFLTWMQEHTSPVFVIATANDINGLPPELMNRFDRTFFLDLPSDNERKDIFIIHLKRAGETFPERRFRLDELVDTSRGFVGREIERVVRESQFTALADGNREIEQPDLLAAIAEVVPMSKSHAEVIDNIRKWKTEGRAFPASSEPAAAPVGRKRDIQV